MIKRRNITFYIFLFLLFFFKNGKSQTVSGILASSATVCANSNNGILTLSGYVGNIIRWEYSLNGASLWTAISNNSSTYNYVNLPQTTYFRAVVQAPSFPALTSNTVVIYTDSPSNGGFVSTQSPTECIGNSTKLSLHGHIGNVLNWQSSLNDGITWDTIPFSNDSVNKMDINFGSDKLYRVVVQNGVCHLTVSDSVKIIVKPLSVGGVVTESATVCSGLNSNTLVVNGQIGDVVRWESSTDTNGPWSTISSTSTILIYTNIINSTYYRSIVKSGNCTEAASTPAFIKVDNVSAGGFISGPQQVCSPVNNGILNLNGSNGSVVRWDFSTNGGSVWNPLSSNTTTYNFSNLTQNTLYKALVVNGACPPVYSNTFLVTVNPLPIVNYSYGLKCEDEKINFTNTSVGNNTYMWDFMDGSGTTITNPMHTYNLSGNYTVKLTATSTMGCTDSISKAISVYPKPNIDFTSVDSICSFSQIIFNNNTSINMGSVSSYAWSFGDNSSTNTSINTNHMYTSGNTYLVKLKAISDMGCIDSLIKPVTVFSKPTADFITQNICKKSSALFLNTSYVNNGSLNYQWSFGDSNISFVTSPTHSYTSVGSYSTSLVVYTNHGCGDTIVKQIYINEQPDISINANNVCLLKPTIFTHTVTPSAAYTLQWNLGNGNVITGINQNYTYPTSGNYNITVTLTTDSGCVSTKTISTIVYPLPYMSFHTNNICSSDTAQITNLCSISSGSLNYFWNLGNNTNSILTNPKIKYGLPGTYSVQLFATTNYGCKDSLTQAITVFDAPTTDFDFTNSCEENPISFNNTSSINSGTISNYLWSFGDNSNATMAHPIKHYQNYGTYTVSLEATSSNGCKSNISKLVSVYEKAKANFSFLNKCLGQAIPFTNSTILNSGTYNSSWNFGDTNTSLANSPTHIYNTEGIKNVRLIVVTNNGCIDSVIKEVEVYALPIINAGNDTLISKGFGANLRATGGVSYSWHPSLGLSNPAIANPIANPDETTVYVVEGENLNGCYNSDTIIVTVENNFLLIPYNIVTPDGNGKNDTWIVKNIENYPNNNLVILDEWGAFVFEQQHYNNTWDGRNKQGNILPDGTYYYILTLENNSVYKGFITLLRNQ